ncbi:MAG: radical SAM protein [Deltaproteobacteria bacterium]|nr:radical SAM protein [Deltaproteobacteria bacterium]
MNGDTEGDDRYPGLPAHVQSIVRGLADESVVGTAMFDRVRKRLPGLIWEILEEGRRHEDLLDVEGQAVNGDILYLKQYRGRFLRFCPGTREYNCCGYRIVHIGENCPLACSYCILQAYFQDRVLKVWANQGDLFAELDRAFGADPRKRFRVGTGEFTDSLVLECLTGYSRDLVGFLGAYENVCLELKSKIVDLSWMEAVARPDRVLPAWSLNSPQVRQSEELGGASLEERLAAAKICAQNGFRVCLHFDPIIRHPGWREGYTRTVEAIFDHLRPENIAYVSLGSFRFMPALKGVIEENFPDSTYIYDEFITGLDGKQRLLRPLRVEQLEFVAGRLRAGGLDRQLYMCMESNEVWRSVLGYTPADLGGLSRHLMAQAFQDV